MCNAGESRDSSVDMAMRYDLDGPSSSLGWGKELLEQG
jgi:hypothetical protein